MAGLPGQSLPVDFAEQRQADRILAAQAVEAGGEFGFQVGGKVPGCAGHG